MTKTKTKVADSMTQASAFWKISVPVMRRAKAAGCGAFIGQRIHIAPLREWLKSHPAEVRAAKQAAAGKGELDALKVRKMQAQVAEIELRVAHQKGELIPAAAAKADWLTAAGIYQEEAKSLMERDHFRIYVDRVYARLQALNHCPPPAQPSPTTRVSSLRNITSPVESKA